MSRRVFGAAELLINSVTLTITGAPDASSLRKATVFGDGAISVTGVTTLLLGQVTLGQVREHRLDDRLGPDDPERHRHRGGGRLGTFTIAPTGSVDVPELSTLSITATFVNRGALQHGGDRHALPVRRLPASDGDFFATAPSGNSASRPPSTSTFTIAGDVTGSGHVELVPGGGGIVSVPAGGTFAPGSLEIDGSARLDLNRKAQVESVERARQRATGGR